MPRNMIYQYVKDISAGRLASGFNHCTRVYHLARELDVDSYDDDVLYAACYLHDIVIEENGHKLSAEKAEQILHEVGFPANKIQLVKEAISTHWPGENPQTIEAKLLHDANLLDSLGAIGVVRLSIGSFLWYHYKTLREVLNLLKENRELGKNLIFPRSKQLAEKKLKFMDETIFELEAEEHL